MLREAILRVPPAGLVLSRSRSKEVPLPTATRSEVPAHQIDRACPALRKGWRPRTGGDA
jgi:hypothetical protein